MRVYDPSIKLLEIVLNKKVSKRYRTDKDQKTPLEKIAFTLDGDTIPTFIDRLKLMQLVQAWLIKKDFSLDIKITKKMTQIKASQGSIYISTVNCTNNDLAGAFFELFDKLIEEALLNV